MAAKVGSPKRETLQLFVEPDHGSEDVNSWLMAGNDPLTSTKKQRTSKWMIFLLSVSLLTNLFLGIIVWRVPQQSLLDAPSKYAGLQRTRVEPYVRQTQYSSDNETLQAQLWHNINVNYGVVALSDEWAAQHDLRTAQRFPWDVTKGVYILHGFHNLHCIKIIYISLYEYRHGQVQSRAWHHVSHCLDALRRQIMCDADDTPRATERRAEVVSGVGQHRKCRDWTALENWAKEHTACYKRPEMPDDKPIIERFKHCPPDTPYIVTDDYVPTDEFLVGLPEESTE